MPPRIEPPASARLKPVGQWSLPAGQVDLGRAAELAAADDDRAFEQLSLLQVAQERGERRVENLDLRAVNLVVGDVGVPAVQGHLDAAHADFDQPPRGQAAAAERRIAVFFAKAFGLLRDVERLELFRAHHHPCAGERFAVQRGVDPGLAAAGEGALEDLQISDPRRVAGGRHAGGDVGQGPFGIVGLEGVEFGAQEAAAAGPLAGEDRDVAGNLGTARPAARGSRSPRSTGARPSGRAGSRASSCRCRARGRLPC